MKIHKIGRASRAYSPQRARKILGKKVGEKVGIQEWFLYQRKKNTQAGDAVVIADAGSGYRMDRVEPTLKFFVDRAKEEGYIPVLVACGCAGGTFIEFAKKENVIAMEHQDFRDWGDTWDTEETNDLINFLHLKIKSAEAKYQGKGCSNVHYYFP